MRAFFPVLVLSGCIGASPVPTAMHPTPSTTDRSVGVAVGGAYQTSEGYNLLSIPHGEGWIRVPAGDGQVGVHVAPSVAHVSYRYDVLKLADGFGLAIEPSLGASYYRFVNEPVDPMDPVQKQQAFAFMVGIAPSLLFPVGPGFAYATPKFGYQGTKNLEAMGGMNDLGDTWALGLSLGIDVGNGLSFELAIHRIDEFEDEVRDTPEAWLFVPTVGVKH